MNSREIIRKLEKAGWGLVRIKGDHHHFKHPDAAGTVTVPHPVSDLGVTLIKLIEKQNGMKLRD